MEGVLEGDHPLLPIMERGQFQGILISLRTGVDQEKRIVIIAAGFTQLIGQLLLQAVDHGVGIETEVAHLLRNGFHVGGMAMPYGDHGMTAIKVEVLIALLVPNVTTFSLDNLYIK